MTDYYRQKSCSHIFKTMSKIEYISQISFLKIVSDKRDKVKKKSPKNLFDRLQISFNLAYAQLRRKSYKTFYM